MHIITRKERQTIMVNNLALETVLEWHTDSQEPEDAPQVAHISGVAIVAHPHPLHGGTMDNKVAQTLAKSLVECGMAVLRFNFRGVGKSEGTYDAGHGEAQDLIALSGYLRQRFPGLPLFGGGFSFGAFVLANCQDACQFTRMVLIGTAVGRFAVPSVPKHTLLIHGSADETVPLSQVLEWASSQQLTIHVLAGADHFFHQRLIPLRHLIKAMIHSPITD